MSSTTWTDEKPASQNAYYMITRTTGRTITYANATFARVCGYELAEIIGSSVMQYVHPSTPAAILEDIFATLGKGQRWDGIMELRRRDSSIFWARCSFSPWYENGKPAGTTTVRTNATQHEIEQALKLRAHLTRNPALYGVRHGRERFVGLASPLNVWRALRSLPLPIILPCLPGLVGLASVLLLSHVKVSVASASTLTVAIPWSLTLATGAIAALVARGRITNPLAQYVSALRLLASGELTHESKILPSTHTKELHRALGVTRESLVSMVSEIRADLSRMTDSISQLSTGNIALAKHTEGQAVSTAQITATLGSLMNSVETTAAGATEAERLAAQAAATSTQGSEAVRAVVECMREIADSARQMKEVTETIEAIAAQTNLLALNAAVESARAGEHGRGFGVVAKEVRALAARAGEATARIDGLIGTTVRRVERGQDRVTAAHNAIENLAATVAAVGDLMTQVASRNQEQNSALGEIHTALGDIDARTQHNAAMVEEASAATEALVAQSEGLRSSAEIFR
ncbi:methyl-accepting chemotaxis protein [Paraburkholderia sp. 22B1P]|nr:methyl-accepting chemotaxis protein [Paraburkholderia sp. 22B1P]